MEKSLKKFLDFNGKKVYLISKEGIWWIAIKPICEALGVDYESQRKNLKNDKILGGAPSEQTVHDASGRLQKMVCLPEFFIYGWIFGIQSNSETLQEYKWKCYEILHNYFHGTITDVSKHLKAKSEAEKQLEQVEKELENSDLFKKRQELLDKINQEKKAAQKSVRAFFTNQMSLWETEEENS